MLLGLAVDLNRLNNRALPIGMVQVARYADPQNSAAAVLLALLFDEPGPAPTEALRMLSGIVADPTRWRPRPATPPRES